MDFDKEEKIQFFKDVDLEKTDFDVKIADFGLSKAISKKDIKMK